MDKVFVIAEAGVNHNGSLVTAKKMVDAAVIAGADAVKFQVFNPGLLVSRYAPKAAYQQKTTPRNVSQLAMLSGLSLSQKQHAELFRYCRHKNIVYLSSPFDSESIDFLVCLKLDILKIPSGEITNLPYLRTIARLRKKVLLSTGMSTLAEIEAALRILTSSGLAKKSITVLHCNTEYPTPFDDVNLRAMLTIRDKCRVSVGYSDHTPGIEVSIAAVALGASVIEKHFTLNKAMPGPDHKASLEPHELKMMISAIRNVEQAMGSSVKAPSQSEKKNIAVIRKSIIAAHEIQKGEKFTADNIITKRPGTGLSPMLWDTVVGKAAKQRFKKDQIISL